MPGGHAITLGAGSVFIVELATGEGGFSIAALDARTGRELWRAPVGSLDSTVQRYVVDGADTLVALESSAAIGPGFPEHRIAARDLRAGKRLWSRENLPPGPSGLPRTAVAAAGGRAFYASVAAGLVTVDARSASGRWTATFAHEDPEFPPRLTANTDLAAVRHVDRLSIFDPATGVQRWTTRLNSGADTETMPAIGERLVLVPRSSSPCV